MKRKQETEPTEEEKQRDDARAKKVEGSEVINKIVFPGDVLTLKPNTKTRIGQGLLQDKNTLVSTKCGLLRKATGGKLWVDNIQKRYMPSMDDLVMGVVVEKHSENYRVDIGTAEPAILPALAFEGATKRNRPNIPVGGIIYARVVVANKDMETELSCISPHVKKEWVTGQTLFGELSGGFVFKCSLSLARKLLDENCFILQCIGQHLPFEIAIGTNGMVWINAKNPLHIIVLNNAILNSEYMGDEEMRAMVQKLVSTL